MTEFEQIYRAYFQDVELYLRAISHNESLAEELTEQVFFHLVMLHGEKRLPQPSAQGAPVPAH